MSDLDLEIIGHRGYAAKAPENTLASLRLALDAGADSVEFDLHVASCGTPVLFHDPSLGRTTNGVGPVRRRTFGQLQQLDAGSWLSPDFAGERIPSFAEALEEVEGKARHAYVEVKGYRELEDLDRVVRIAEQAGALDRTIFISLDWGIVDRIGGRSAEVRVGYVVDDPTRLDAAFTRALDRGPALVDVEAGVARQAADALDKAHARGIPTAVWTVNDARTADELAALGVTRFTTDEVGSLVEWKAART